MSAFLVEDDTINQVVNWLSWEVTSSPRLKISLEHTLGINTRSATWERELGEAMFQLNVAAVTDRITMVRDLLWVDLADRLALDD